MRLRTRRGNGVALPEETVEEGFLLKRENAMMVDVLLARLDAFVPIQMESFAKTERGYEIARFGDLEVRNLEEQVASLIETTRNVAHCEGR